MSKAAPKGGPAADKANLQHDPDSSQTPYAGTDNPGQHLATVHDCYRRWFGSDYDLHALDVVLCAAAAERLDGDPPWLQMIGGSGLAKTETLMPLTGANALVVSTISGEAALLSGTSKKERAKDATGGLLCKVGPRGLLVIKDFTSILSMNRDTRALVLAALREIYDGRWSRDVGTDGGMTLKWEGRIVLIGACTTAWDSAYQVVATMGDRFLLVRPRTADRRASGRQAMSNVGSEARMRRELAASVGELLAASQASDVKLGNDDEEIVVGLADLVTRARTGVERDYQGNPLFAHDAEMPTRLAKQLVQLVRGGLALGMSYQAALAVADRSAADTIPPLRRKVLCDVAANPDSLTTDVVRRLQLPRKTVDRVLQELHLLGLLVVGERTYGQSVRWIYSLADDVSTDTLARIVSAHGKPETPAEPEHAEAGHTAGDNSGQHSDSGPCTGCGKSCKRYGPHGRPLCHDCSTKPPARLGSMAGVWYLDGQGLSAGQIAEKAGLATATVEQWLRSPRRKAARQ